MCQCGCSEGNYEAKLPAPDGGWYLLRRYAGCADCEAPVGLDILRVSGKEPHEFHTPSLDEIPELRMLRVDGVDEASIAFMAPDAFTHDRDDDEEEVEPGKLQAEAHRTFTDYPLAVMPLGEVEAD